MLWAYLLGSGQANEHNTESHFCYSFILLKRLSIRQIVFFKLASVHLWIRKYEANPPENLQNALKKIDGKPHFLEWEKFSSFCDRHKWTGNGPSTEPSLL